MTASGEPFIAAFDVATATGCADGIAGGRPRFWTWQLSDAGKGRPSRLAYLRRFADAYFAETKVDRVYYEGPLNIAVMMEIGASDETISLLRGAIGVLEAAAVIAGIPIIEPVPIGDARKLFCGVGRFAKGEAKTAVQARCQVLGHKVEDEHQADSLAVWYWASAHANPRAAALLPARVR